MLLQALLIELTTNKHLVVDSASQKQKPDVGSVSGLPDEVKIAIGPHKVQVSESDEVFASIGAGCLKFQEDLVRYMSYEIGGVCPVDDVFAQKLILKGCEPLPRRRCHPKSPNVTGLLDLQGKEKMRWIYDNGRLDFGIDEVLRMKPEGMIRIGLDIGSGKGTFAARMQERNVTVVTSAMNLDGFVASKGLIAMQVSVSQRLPFFENMLDIVHSMDVLSYRIPDAMLEFVLYDVHRVLKPGGLFWIDNFLCLESQVNVTYVPMLEKVRFKKLRWFASAKFGSRKQRTERYYFSALLEKPMT